MRSAFYVSVALLAAFALLALSIRNESRVEGIVTVERDVPARLEHKARAQRQLLNVGAAVPSLGEAASSDERLSILRAVISTAFGADLYGN